MNTPARLILTLGLGASLISGCAGAPKARTHATGLSPESVKAANATATQQVLATERAFARTMTARDFSAFVKFLSPEAVFFSGNSVRHGSAEVAELWEPYFNGPDAPFTWAPDHVEVLASGTLALSTGPVYQQGRLVGRFSSIWRLDAPNTWHIVFDKGEAVCKTTS
jgi:ketosteroid isomerase-like protein